MDVSEVRARGEGEVSRAPSASTSSTPRVRMSRDEILRSRRQVMFDSDDERDQALYAAHDRDRDKGAGRKLDAGYGERDRTRSRSNDREEERILVVVKGEEEEFQQGHHEVHSARERRSVVAPRRTPPTAGMRGRSASPAIRQAHYDLPRRRGHTGARISDSDSDLDDIAARHASNYLAQTSSPPRVVSSIPPSGSRAMWPPRQKASLSQVRDRDRDGSGHRSPNGLVFSEVRDMQDNIVNVHEEVRVLREKLSEQDRMHSVRIHGLEKARDRAEDEVRALKSVVEGMQAHLEELQMGHQWLLDRMEKMPSKKDLNLSSRSSPNHSHGLSERCVG